MNTTQRHGKLFSRGGDRGGLIVHVQRENGLAHRTFVLRGWQLWMVRLLARRGVQITLALLFLVSLALSTQAARVPLLTQRIAHLEADQQRLDTLQQHLSDLQARYDAVQRLMSRTGPEATPSSGATCEPTRVPAPAAPGTLTPSAPTP